MYLKKPLRSCKANHRFFCSRGFMIIRIFQRSQKATFNHWMTLHLENFSILFLPMEFWWSEYASYSYQCWHTPVIKSKFLQNYLLYSFHRNFNQKLRTWKKNQQSKKNSLVSPRRLRIVEKRQKVLKIFRFSDVQVLVCPKLPVFVRAWSSECASSYLEKSMLYEKLQFFPVSESW